MVTRTLLIVNFIRTLTVRSLFKSLYADRNDLFLNFIGYYFSSTYVRQSDPVTGPVWPRGSVEV